MLLILLITLFIPALSWPQQAEKTIREIAADIQNTKDTEQRQKMFKELAKITVKTSEDVEDIAGVIRSSKEDNEKEYGFKILRNIGEENKHLERVFLKLLNDPDRDVRTAAIINLGKFKTKEAAPRLREIVKGFSKIDSMKFKTLRAVDIKRAYRIIFEPGAAAMSLGEMKDEEAIPVLVEKFDELEGYAAIGLSKIGKKALPAILELARKETDPNRKDSPAQKALAGIEDKEAKSDLINILRTEKNRDIRYRVLISLTGHMFDDEVLETIKNLYEKERDTLFLWPMKRKEGIPFLINVLNDRVSDARTRRIVVGILGDIWDPSVIPVLEESLKDNNRDVRGQAVDALIPLGDTDTLMRLKDFLMNNVGIAGSIEHDTALLKIIENRLKSGKRGAITFDETEDN